LLWREDTSIEWEKIAITVNCRGSLVLIIPLAGNSISTHHYEAGNTTFILWHHIHYQMLKICFNVS